MAPTADTPCGHYTPESRLSRTVSGAAITVAACAPLVIAATLAFAPADLERYGYPALLTVGLAGFAHLARHHIAQALACVMVAGLVGAVAAFTLGSAPVLF